VIVLVNGKEENAGKATTTTSGKVGTTIIVVDPAKLQAKLNAEGNGSVVTVPVTLDSNIIVAELNGQIIKNMENASATLVFQTSKGTYTLPADEINIDALAEKLGNGLKLEDIKLKITISETSPSMDQVVVGAASDEEDIDDNQTVSDKVILPKEYQMNRDHPWVLVKHFARDQDKVQYLKFLYNNTCQVCGHKMDLGGGETYSETHHLHPRLEDGTDLVEKMMVLCSNCHVLVDRAAFMIDLKNRRALPLDLANVLNNMLFTQLYFIERRYINYYNIMRFKGSDTK
jgi:hypothetical protein